MEYESCICDILFALCTLAGCEGEGDEALLCEVTTVWTLRDLGTLDTQTNHYMTLKIIVNSIH